MLVRFEFGFPPDRTHEPDHLSAEASGNPRISKDLHNVYTGAFDREV